MNITNPMNGLESDDVLWTESPNGSTHITRINMTISTDGVSRDTGHSVSSGLHSLSWDDATWILTSSFIIFTMQTGFGLIESGAVNSKNEVNIMVKNAIDVIFGGITYWAFGFGFSFGNDPGSNAFNGLGYWFVNTTDPDTMGQIFSTFIFQLSFATTATTIVSGAMAERTRLKSYICFSLFNTLVYCFPAHWIWADNGFLHTLGCIDIAGSGAVHLLGAGSALVAACMLGPRKGRYDNGTKPLAIGNGTNSLIGMFMLWWGWLAFNSGSTFGISGGKWILASKTAVTTLASSMGGGVSGVILVGIRNQGKILIPDLINSVLGSLVSITACCPLVEPWEAVIIGAIGGILCSLTPALMDYVKIDDPVGAFAVHGVGGIWGLLAVGFFTDIDRIEYLGGDGRGLFHGGGARLFGVQLLAAVTILSWSMLTSFIMLFVINKTFGLRLSPEEEEIGSDFLEHGIGEPPVPGDSDLEKVLHRHTKVQNSCRQKTTVFGYKRESIDFSSLRKRPNEKEESNTQKAEVTNEIHITVQGTMTTNHTEDTRTQT